MFFLYRPLWIDKIRKNKAYVGFLNLQELNEQKEDYNILILGETGVGKSTWINGIANYSKYNSLQHAMEDPELTVLVPLR